jgi:hypothetical protein
MKKIIGIIIFAWVCTTPYDSFSQTTEEEYNDTLSHPLEGKFVVIKLIDNTYLSGDTQAARTFEDRTGNSESRSESPKRLRRKLI